MSLKEDLKIVEETATGEINYYPRAQDTANKAMARVILDIGMKVEAMLLQKETEKEETCDEKETNCED